MDEKKILNLLYYLAGQGYGDNTVWEIIDQKERQAAKREEFEQVKERFEETMKICAATGKECTWCGMGPCDSRKEVTP